MMKRRSLRKVGLGAVLALVAATVGLVAAPAGAESVDIPIGQVFPSGHEGDVVGIGGTDVDAHLVGRTCNIVATVTNQSSVHAGNELVVKSGDSTVTIAGIEDTADAVTMQGGSLTLGNRIDVSVKLGPDGLSSLGSSLTLTCEDPPEAKPAAPVEAKPDYTG